VPLFPKNPSHEKTKKYAGIKNGVKSIALQIFGCFIFTNSSKYANMKPRIIEKVAVKEPITIVLRKIFTSLLSRESVTNLHKSSRCGS
jgi:hypothetical protein